MIKKVTVPFEYVAKDLTGDRFDIKAIIKVDYDYCTDYGQDRWIDYLRVTLQDSQGNEKDLTPTESMGLLDFEAFKEYLILEGEI